MNDILARILGLNGVDLRRVSSMTLQFRNAGALGWLVFAAILLGGFVWWSYFMQEGHRELTPWRRGVLAALRMTLLALILLMLLRPVLALDLEEQIRRTVVLLVDSTKSMEIRDQRVDEADIKRAEIAMGAIHGMAQPLDASRATGAKTISRRDLVKAVLENESLHLQQDLAKNFNLETYLFGRTATAAEGPYWLVDYRPSIPVTAIGDSVRDVLERKRGQPLAGIILMTDGGNNSGGSPEEAAAEAAREGVPIYAYGAGITSPRDIIVSHLTAPEIAFAGDDLDVTVQLRGQGLTGETGRLSLKLGPDEVASQDVVFTGSDQPSRSLSSRAQKAISS